MRSPNIGTGRVILGLTEVGRQWTAINASVSNGISITTHRCSVIPAWMEGSPVDNDAVLHHTILSPQERQHEWSMLL
jgi:hypothetical protein